MQAFSAYICTEAQDETYLLIVLFLVLIKPIVYFLVGAQRLFSGS